MLMFLFFGCSPTILDDQKLAICDTGELDETAVHQDTAEPEEDTSEPEEDTADLLWSEAQLVLLSPEPSAYIALGENHLFEAAILDVDGNDLEFTEIAWSSSIDSDWTAVDNSFEDTLSAGRHTITAEARLPNGDRLSHAVGGVLVQHPDAGIYAGTTSIDLTIDYSPPIIVSCSGGVTLTVQPDGEIGYGEGECIVNINGGDIPSTYAFDLEIFEGDLTGSASLDLWLIQQAFPLTGNIGNGEITAEWADTVLGFIDVVGSMNLSRVSLY
jgi:hypothetical protein